MGSCAEAQIVVWTIDRIAVDPIRGEAIADSDARRSIAPCGVTECQCLQAAAIVEVGAVGWQKAIEAAIVPVFAEVDRAIGVYRGSFVVEAAHGGEGARFKQLWLSGSRNFKHPAVILLDIMTVGARLIRRKSATHPTALGHQHSCAVCLPGRASVWRCWWLGHSEGLWCRRRQAAGGGPCRRSGWRLGVAGKPDLVADRSRDFEDQQHAAVWSWEGSHADLDGQVWVGRQPWAPQ